jgi:hypothetical protein
MARIYSYFMAKMEVKGSVPGDSKAGDSPPYGAHVGLT